MLMFKTQSCLHAKIPKEFLIELPQHLQMPQETYVRTNLICNSSKKRQSSCTYSSCTTSSATVADTLILHMVTKPSVCDFRGFPARFY